MDRKKMKIYQKDVWGFWIFKRYSLFLEDDTEGLREILVDKKTWEFYNVGDYYEIWGFWIFKRYSLFLEDDTEGLREILVDKKTWEFYNVGDYYEIS